MLIDTHAHLDYPDFVDDFSEVLRRAEEAGVTRIITIGTGVESSKRAVEIAEKHAGVYAVIGLHPTNVQEVSGDAIAELRALAAHPKVVAIGETGLDYHRLPGDKILSPLKAVYRVEQAEDPNAVSAELANQAYKNLQADYFRAQLDLAVELGLNVVIHQRDAWQDTLDILRPYGGKLRGVFHCFGGTPEQAAELRTMGHLVSFTGIVTFKNAGVVRDTAMAVSSDGYMVETDCPYLAPAPHRGKRCEPWHTRLVAEKIAELRGIPLEQVAEETTRTAESFFRMED